jgi:D-lactate dehydrogenase
VAADAARPAAVSPRRAGIVANNSSGMCCGVKQNTYHTLQDMRVVLVDGTTLDTGDAASRAAFTQSHAALLAGLSELAARVQGDAPLMQLIHKKYSIKNTTGYSINALVRRLVEEHGVPVRSEAPHLPP